MQRTPLKRRRAKPRKGRITDLAYLRWCGTQPCIVSGLHGVTLHHVRRFGEPKQDRRVVPLLAQYHLYQSGEKSIEALGKEEFQRRFEIDLEAEIIRLNLLYEGCLSK